MHQVDSFAFLQSTHSTAFVCWRRPPWSLPSFAAVQRWCGCEGPGVITPPLLLLLFSWSETLFAQVDYFAFLQSIHSTAFVCSRRPPWSLPSFAAVQRWCGGEGQQVITPPYYCYCFCEVKLCLRKLILLLFFSQNTPLHRSARGGHLEVCRLLLQCNADVDAKSVR